MSEASAQLPEKSALTLIQQLKDGSIHPSTLTKEQRQQCVEVLMFEGYPVSQIAQVVGHCEKTIRRDLDDIRAKNALSPSSKFSKQFIGVMFIQMEAHHGRLMRTSRSSEVSGAEKIQAEFLAFRVLKEKTELLQSLGYLPRQPRQAKEESNDDRKKRAFTNVLTEIRLMREAQAKKAQGRGDLPPLVGSS